MNENIKLFKALSDTNRVRIIKLLQIRTLCVCEITEMLSLATSTVSKHLSILKDAGFIADEKIGKWVHYKLKTGCTKTDELIKFVDNWFDYEPLFKSDIACISDSVECCSQIDNQKLNNSFFKNINIS